MKTLTTFQIAKTLSVDISTIIDWIDAGRIAAFRTPGGHRRVKPSDLLSFLKKYKMPISDAFANMSSGGSALSGANSAKVTTDVSATSPHQLVLSQKDETVGGLSASGGSASGMTIPLPHINSPATKKILIVDDDEDVLKFISKTIIKLYPAKGGVKIEFALEGFIASKKIAEFKPDLLILNIYFHGMSGFEALEHLDSSEKNMKILVIIAHLSKGIKLKRIKEKIIKAGADDYLIKPFTVEQLKQKIKNLLD
ncbi:MAG: response regulator [Elusimicrobiota bacterium]